MSDELKQLQDEHAQAMYELRLNGLRQQHKNRLEKQQLLHEQRKEMILLHSRF